MNTRRKAFTLAEVLVTLAVIGVVASLTIPSLVKNYQEKQDYIRWRKAYSVFKQAVMMMNADGVTSIGNCEGSSPPALTTFASYIKFVKTTGDNITVPYDTYKNNTKAYTETFTSHGITADGTVFFFQGDYDDCAGTSNSLTNLCGDNTSGWIIRFDVNGINHGPNMIGKDLFALWLAKEHGEYKVYPAGYLSGGYDGTWCISGTAGHMQSFGCSALALTRDPEAMP